MRSVTVTVRNCLFVTVGIVLGGWSVIKAHHADPYHQDTVLLSVNAGYLLQIYASYFTAILLVLFHCIACKVWQASNIQYIAVFGHDPCYASDWNRLAEFPSFCLFILGLVMQLNFRRVGGDTIHLHYPVILLVLTGVMILNPVAIFCYRSRRRFLHRLWRILFAGLYPIEWYDCYTGDMLCSLSYSMGNIALLSCLYASRWSSPTQCNSSHSYTLGFITALPSIWRALQCTRAYRDNGKNVFLLNCAKYLVTIIMYGSLSMYRIDQTILSRRIFVIVAIVQGTYSSFWDMYYDWNLGSPDSACQFLRPTLAYQNTWIYYTAIVLNPVLRFSWILCVIGSLQFQYAAPISFGVSIGEVFRRGLWSLLRVESEHCTSVAKDREDTLGVAGPPCFVGAEKGFERPVSAKEDSNALPQMALPARPARTYRTSTDCSFRVTREVDNVERLSGSEAAAWLYYKTL